MATLDDLKEMPGEALTDAAPWIVLLARIGYAAKGLVYVIVGSIAATAALAGRSSEVGPGDALATIHGSPFGKVTLSVMALGLFGYAVWRLLEAALDPERRGSGWKGVAKRLGSAAKGLAYGSFGVTAFHYITRGGGTTTGGEQRAKSLTGMVLDQPFGQALLVAIAAGVLGWAGYQAYRAGKGSFAKRLSLGRLTGTIRRLVVNAGRIGIIARAIVFASVAILLGTAALTHDASRAAGTEGGLSALGQQPWGEWLLVGVSLGLVAYGIWQFVEARYRQIARPA
jgi:hypothetical protein